MKVDIGETNLRINMSFAATVTLMLILDESGKCALTLLCCVVHELGHLICLFAIGEKPAKIELSFYGIKLERSRSFSENDIIIFFSGPAANFIFSFAAKLVSIKVPSLEYISAASLMIGAFNLIPCVPLDGGNILYRFLSERKSEKTTEKICFAVSLILVPLMLFSGIVVALGNGNFTLAAVSGYLAAIIFLNKNEIGQIKV